MRNLQIVLSLLVLSLSGWARADGVDWLHLMPQINSSPTRAPLSADGTTIVSGSADGILRFWDYRTGRLTRVINAGLTFADTSPNSRKVVVACTDKTGRIYNMDTGLLEITLPWHTGTINQIIYSPNGLHIASASADQSIGLWNALNGDQDFALLCPNSVLVVAFSPDNTKLAAVTNSSIKTWDVASGSLLTTIATGFNPPAICWSANSQEVLACVGSPRVLTAWNGATGLVTRVFTPTSAYANNSLKLSPDGSLFAGFSDGLVRVFDMNTSSQIRSFQNSSVSTGFSFAQGGSRLLIACNDVTIKERDATTGALLNTLGVDHRRNWSASWNADSSRLLMVGEDHALRLYDRQFKLVSAANVPYAMQYAAIAPSGQVVATALPNGVVAYNLLTGAVVRSYTTTGAYEVAYSPDGTLLAATVNNNVLLWNASSGALLRTWPMGTSASALCVKFSPDGTKLAASSGNNLVHYEYIFDVASGATLQTLVGHTKFCYGMNFSPNGASLVTGSTDMSIRIWDVATGANLRTIMGHTGDVEDVMYLPDGQTLVSSSADQTLKFWNANTGELIRAYDNSNYSAPYHLTVSPDGTQVATPGLISGIVRTPRMIYGKALLGDYVGPRLGETLSVQVWQNGSLVQTLDGTYAEDGSYGIWPSVTGTMTLKFKLRNGLRKAVTVTLGTTVLTGVDVLMTNGDSDGSGEIDAADIDAVISDFGGTSVSADIDGSNEVDAADIDIVIAHFGAVGD